MTAMTKVVSQRLTRVQLESLLALDMVSLAERGLGSVLADNPDLFRHTFRRGELYNAASSSRGVQCQLLATTVTSTEQLQQPRLQQRQQSSSQLHWAYGPAIYQHLRDVCTIPLGLLYERYFCGNRS